MTSVLEGALVAGLLMGGSFLLALALCNSRIQTMSDLVIQERQMRQKAEQEARIAEQMPGMQQSLVATTDVLDKLDVTVGKMLAVMQRGGHFRTDGEATPIEPGSLTVRHGERRATSPNRDDRTRSLLPERAEPI